ncbi:helix-turn-helix domain-containing protein [Gemmata sp. JC673]|uniref:Helix-turn-helix domain-containing protein n=1 Tax=Gemmata algarum TaxID=2975278 RepID=A0ABU5EUK4_9BACT|nr:helix-turn-helix domain-containing protein [Gemmata algarum]MDY3558978.1 helix-turn-helix domain-containing protein [Gemmata algarum]
MATKTTRAAKRPARAASRRANRPAGWALVPKTFLALNARFPLRTIRSPEELAFARELVAELMVRDDLDDGSADYLDTLSQLVQRYEIAAHPMPEAAEGDVLRVLMEGRGVSQPVLAKEVGIAQSTLSAVLTGKRTLTREHIVALAAYFNVSPIAFMGGPSQKG